MAAEGLNDSLDVGAGLAPMIGMAFGPVGGVIGQGLGMGMRAFSQWNRSRHTKVPPRPIATTPQEIVANQQNARQIASGALADATNTLASQQLYQNQAQAQAAGRESSRSSTDMMGILGRANQNTNNALNNLALQRYQQRVGGYGMLSGANQNMANYADRNFAYNQVEPYNQAVQNKQNLLTASNTNWDRAAQYGMGNIMGMEQMRMFAPGYQPSRGVLDWFNKKPSNIYGSNFVSTTSSGNPYYDTNPYPNTMEG